MVFNSIDYLIFLPIVILINFILPKKVRYLWLLAASYFFYMCWDAKYALLILFSTIVTYICGLLLENIKRKAGEESHKKTLKNVVVAVGLLLNLGVLFYFKYTDFLVGNLFKVLRCLNLTTAKPSFDIVLPVGISFFTFQALGYIIDVYRDEIQAEKNPFRYALFVSFFPQLVAGPIERSKNLLYQLRETHDFDADNARNGLLTLAYGLFLKIVVADNISAVIDPIFSNYKEYSGMSLLFATILFAFQIYCDFNGYTQMAIGGARILGYRLKENFNAPYMGRSVKDFWRRWHISLTSWFTDYLYIPLGGSRKGKLRKQLNTMIVFLCSGLWHGAAWHYVAWGGLNGIFSVAEDLIKPLYQKIKKIARINSNSFMFKFFQRSITFLIIDFTWLFFRAGTLRKGLAILKKICSGFRLEWFLNFEFADLFSSTQMLLTVTFALVLMIVVDVLKYYGKDVKKAIFSQQVIFRWIIYLTMLLIILFWGLYGTGYEQTQFIYFQF